MREIVNADDVCVEWTGSYPNLCSGEWIVIIHGLRVGGIQPDNFGTNGEYDDWGFTDDWDVVWTTYNDGDDQEQWIDLVLSSDINHLITSLEKHNIKPSRELLAILFKKIKAVDWRHNSCGGCI